MAGRTKEATALLDIAEIRREKAYRCKQSFAYFLRHAWHVIEPARPLVWGIHVDAMTLHLQAVGDGELHKLVVNLAPGFGKSSVFSVAFPAWVWARNPYERFLCASYAMDLSIRDRHNCRMLIESEWYHSLFGDMFQMLPDNNQKSFYENTQRGYMQATATFASGTGKRCTIGIIDDPNNGMAGKAEVEETIAWYGKTWVSRQNDQEKGASIVVGQRLRSNDLTGHLLSLGGWTHLMLPNEYEPSRKCSTSIGWEDPRTQEGELLCPQLQNEEATRTLKTSMGALDYAAQEQQSPVPAGGHIFHKANERLFTIDDTARLYLLHTPEGIRPVKMDDCALHITSDVAAKAKEQSDYTVFAVWAVTPRKEVLLLYVLREHMIIPKQVENGYLTYQAYTSGLFHAFWFEDVAYQNALGQFLLEKGVPCLPFHPVGDKVLRANGASVWMAAGNVYFLAGASWLETWRAELYQFPKGKHDDQVDNLSAIVIIVKGQPLPLQGDEPNDTITQAGHDAAAVYLATIEDMRTQEQDVARQIEALKRQLAIQEAMR